MGKRTKRILALLLSLCLCMQYAVAFEGSSAGDSSVSSTQVYTEDTTSQDTTGDQTEPSETTGEGTGENTETTPDSSGDTASGTESDGTQPTGSDSAPTGETPVNGDPDGAGQTETEPTDESTQGGTDSDTAGDDATGNTGDTSSPEDTASSGAGSKGNTLTDANTAETDGEVESEPEDAAGAEAPLLSYLVINTPQLAAPATQEILIGIGDEATTVEQATLTVRNQSTGETASYDASELAAGAALFRISYGAGQSGTYALESLRYTYGGVETAVNFADIGIDAAFGVDAAAESSPDAVVVEEETSTASGSEQADVIFDVATLDEGGDAVLADSVEDALGDADAQTAESGISTMSLDDAVNSITSGARSGNVVVVLDPGHDNSHGGTSGTTNGVSYKEQDYNLKIAQYCKAALEQYAGITVYMTRESNTCPFGGSSVSSTECNAQRVAFAQSVGAEYYVSIHLNSFTSSSAQGAVVYYPNQNYRPDLSEDGKELAQEILDQLVDLGLQDRGVTIRNSEDNTQYPDGSLADYYGVIRRCKEAGIAGIIVEHAFMTSPSDFENFLSSDAKLKQLGEADAAGIASYLDLSLSGGSGSDGGSGSGSGETPSTPSHLTVLDGVDYAVVYDYEYYISHNADVKAAFGGDEAAVLRQFVNYGMAEGRRASANFDVTSYRNQYPDLRQAYGSNLKSYYMHYVNYGHAEGRQGTGCTELQGGITVYNGVDYAQVYNYNYYINQNPDVKAAFGGDEVAVLRQFVNYGMAEGRRASANFDVTSYRNQYPDLRQAYGSNLKSYYMHYIDYGYAEGRQGTGCTELQGGITVYNGVDYAPVYNYNYYISHNADVKAAFGGDEMAVLRQFVNYGMAEGRQAASNFDLTSYRNLHADLRHAYGSDLKSYYMHYINYGRAEGRPATGCTEMRGYLTVLNGVDYSAVYDYNYYINHNGDLKAAYNWDEAGLLRHFVNYGMDEGRRASASFDVDYYRANYGDLRSAYGDDLKSYYMHYIDYGKTEGRLATSYLNHPIMNDNTATAAQMAAFFRSKDKSFNSSVYGMSLDQLCQIYLEEGAAEGVDALVAFSQAIIETGYFSSSRALNQFNFCGLGATDGGAAGANFNTSEFGATAAERVRMGVRAQMQHLKAYGSTAPLNNPCIDPRFNLVSRGSAVNVEDLGNGKWATDPNYASKLLNIMIQVVEM